MKAALFKKFHVFVSIIAENLFLRQIGNIKSRQSFDESSPKRCEIFEGPNDLEVALAIETTNLEFDSPLLFYRLTYEDLLNFFIATTH